jgi:hypothetical protein
VVGNKAVDEAYFLETIACKQYALKSNQEPLGTMRFVDRTPLAVTDFVLLRYRVCFLKIELNDRW